MKIAFDQPQNASGFTLVMTLSILAAVTILVVGLFSIVSVERQVSSSFDAVEQADLAIQAGLTRAAGLLDQSLRDESGVIFSMPLNAEPSYDEDGQLIPALPTNLLMAANFQPTQGEWIYTPLISGAAVPTPTPVLGLPNYQPTPRNAGESEPQFDDDGVEIPASPDDSLIPPDHLPPSMPWQNRPPVFWENLNLPGAPRESENEEEESEDEGDEETADEGEIVARFCFHVDDLQGYLSQGHSGNVDGADGRHLHAPFSFETHTIPGLNLSGTGPLLNQSALYTLFQPAAEGDESEIGRRLVRSRRVLISPDMWREAIVQEDDLTNWPGRDRETFLTRVPMDDGSLLSGRFEEPSARAIEEHTVSAVQSYLERAVIPYDPAIERSGEPKLNLNRLLQQIEALPADERAAQAQLAVDEIASHIQRHLPQFSSRRGGYSLGSDPPFAYLQCLAAGMIDYADTDSLPTLIDGEYRGTDAFPIVSEQWQRYRFERSFIEDGSRYVEYSITQYLELWNMSNQPTAGEVQVSFECNGSITAGAGVFDVMNVVTGTASQGEITSGQPTEEQGLWWHAPVEISLQPNEYRVVMCAPVVFKLRSGPSSSTATNTVEFRGNDSAGSDMSSRYRLRFRPTGASNFVIVDQSRMPVERYQRSVGTSTRQRFNTTHPGMSYAVQNRDYANNVGDPRAAWFINYSQDVVNYDDGSSPGARNLRHNIGLHQLYRENRINLWPDGGHNNTARSGSIGSLNRNPDHLEPPPPPPEPLKFVQRISNRGRFFSVTELGHIFDPIMWDPNGGPLFDTPTYTQFADLRPGTLVTPVDKYCGGNSLRIGRPEHTRFRPDYEGTGQAGQPTNRAMCASTLLDLFHCGIPYVEDESSHVGGLQAIDGHVNLNTATRETLRALAAGRLVQDPMLKRSSEDADPNLANPVVMHPPRTSDDAPQADIIADSIISARPFLSAAELPEKLLINGQPFLGYSRLNESVPASRQVEPEWNDAAAEEIFARLYNQSTVRSRNFRVIVTGQTLRRTRSGQIRVLATRSRLYHVFIRPIRDAEGFITGHQPEITYARAL